MVGFRRVNRRTCTDPLVSCSVPLLGWYRDRTWSRGLHGRARRPRCRSGRCDRHASMRSSRRRDWGSRWSARGAGHGSLRSNRRSDRRSRWSARGAGHGSLRSNRRSDRRSRWSARGARHGSLRPSRRSDRRSHWSAGGAGRMAGRLLVHGTLGRARLRAWRLRPTDLGACPTSGRGSAGTGRAALLCPRLGAGLRHGRRARLHRPHSLLPRGSDRTGCGSGCVWPTSRGRWRRRGSHPRLLHRGRSRAALRVPGLPSKPESGQKALSGR